MNHTWLSLFFLVFITTTVYSRHKVRRSYSVDDPDKELRRTKRTIYQALLKRIRKRDANQYVDINHVIKLKPIKTKRVLTRRNTKQSQEIRVEIRIIHPWRDEMMNRSTPEYKLIAGNLEDAIRNELNADLNFITSSVMKLNKTNNKHKMLAVLSLRFYKTEVNPERHIQGILNRGWISGQQVDPGYFKLINPLARKTPPAEAMPDWAVPQQDDLHIVPAQKYSDENNNETVEVEEDDKFQQRNKTNIQYKEITVTIKLKQRYQVYLADKNSPEYKELSGNVEQAVMKVFSHDVFFLEGHVISFSESEEGRVFCILAIQFKHEEKFSIEKCQAAISTGNLAGIPVDDQFFRVDSLGETDKDGTNLHPIVSPPASDIPKPTANKHKIKMLPLHYIEMRFSVKINKTWSNELSDNTTKEFSTFSGQIEQAMDRGLFQDLNYIDSNVIELIESGEHMIITNIATRFQLNETDPELTVRTLIVNGTLSGIPLDDTFFFVFSISYRIKPPTPPANGVPQVEQGQTPLQQQQSALATVVQQNGQKQQAENLPSATQQQWQEQQQQQQQLLFQQPQQQQQQPQQAIDNPGNVQITSQPPIRNTTPPYVVSGQETTPQYLNSGKGTLETGYPEKTYPFPQSNQQSWYPTPSTGPYPPMEINSPQATSPTSASATSAPIATVTQLANVRLNKIEGSVTLQQNWDSSLSDTKSQDYKSLEFSLVNAIKGLYGQINEDVVPEIVGFSETAVPTTSETKVSVRFVIESIPLIDTKPLEDAARLNNINGIPIYENTLVVAGEINPITHPPFTTTPATTLCQQQQKSADETSNGAQIGSFVPQCLPDGQYKPVQCHALTGFCWCVDNAGVRLQGTEQRYKQPNCEGISLSGNVYLPLNTTSDLPEGSCLTVSVQEMILCGNDVNCHIPVIVNETFRNISLIKNAIPFELMAPKMKPGRYVVSAAVNVGWCRVNSIKTKLLIHPGDYHNTELYDIDIDRDTKTVEQDIYVEPVVEEETDIHLFGIIKLPNDTNPEEFNEESCMSIITKELKPCVGVRCGVLPTSSNITHKKIEVVKNAMLFDVLLPNLNPGTYAISVVIHTTRCLNDGQNIQDGDYYNEDMQEFTVEPSTIEIEKLINVVKMKDSSAGTTVSGRVHFPDGVTSVDSGSCLTVSSRKLIKCKNNNCKIPPVSSKTFENITYEPAGVPYSLSLPVSSPGFYLISAVINNGWCKLNNEGVWIQSGDFYNDKTHDFEIKNATEPIGKNIQTAIYNPKNNPNNGLTINGRVYLPTDNGQDIAHSISPQSCLVIKIQEFTLCNGDTNCIIPLAKKEVFRELHVEGNSIPYVVAMSNVMKKHYIISAVLNVNWCQDDNPYSPNYIRDGDLHNNDEEDFVVPDNQREITKHFELSIYTEKSTDNEREDNQNIPKIYNSTKIENSSPEPTPPILERTTPELGKTSPNSGLSTTMSPELIMASKPETMTSTTLPIEEVNSTVPQETPTSAPPTSLTISERPQPPDMSTVYQAKSKTQQENLSPILNQVGILPKASKPSILEEISPLMHWNNIISNKTKNTLSKGLSLGEESLPFFPKADEKQVKAANPVQVAPIKGGGKSKSDDEKIPIIPILSNVAQHVATNNTQQKTGDIVQQNTNAATQETTTGQQIAATYAQVPTRNSKSSSFEAKNSKATDGAPTHSSKTELPELSVAQNRELSQFLPVNSTATLLASPVDAPVPPPPPSENKTSSIESPLVTLPKGLPRSCDQIRNAGIGNMDGQYIIEAREGCHLSIICQDMEGSAPKEFLGGPSEDEWRYWHFAVLIKISDNDKHNIPQGACLENSEKGKDLLQRILIAGAKQGNPISEWKTNIAKLLRTKRNTPPGTSVITRAKTIYKDLGNDGSEWGVL